MAASISKSAAVGPAALATTTTIRAAAAAAAFSGAHPRSPRIGGPRVGLSRSRAFVVRSLEWMVGGGGGV